jgi:hypothetical protein
MQSPLHSLRVSSFGFQSNIHPRGVYRRDMIYFEEGGKANKNTINFKIKRAMFMILQEITKFQQIPYNLSLDTGINLAG